MDKKAKQPLLRLHFKGEAIHEGRILYSDLSTFVSNLTLAIERIIKGMQTGESIKRGRPSKTIQLLSSLEIAYARKHSFSLALDLRRNGRPFPGWDLGEQATDILVAGINALGKDESLPDEYDHGVLIALREAGKIIDRGVDKISINSSSSFGARKALYTQPVRDKVISKIRRYEQAYAVVEGRLLSVDVKEDRLRCRIEPSVGEPTLCTFDETLIELILRFMRHFVQARGEATYDTITGKITMLHIKDLESIEESSVSGATKVALSSFWETKDFEELAIEQGVYPVDDISTLIGGWPEDEDIDSFLSNIRSSRVN